MQCLQQRTVTRCGQRASCSRRRSLILLHHQSLQTARLSTTAIGTSYEHVCAHVLRRLGFDVQRTGGRSDRGVDLLGVWKPPRHPVSIDPPPPSSTNPISDASKALSTATGAGTQGAGIPTVVPSSIRVVVQCKAHATPPKPMWIRELEGSIAGAPGEWRDSATIGVLVAKRGATDGCRDAMRRAERGIIWVCIESLINERDGHGNDRSLGDGDVEGKLGRVTQMLLNEKVKQVVGPDVGAGLRYIPGSRGKVEQEVVITFQGRCWEGESGH